MNTDELLWTLGRFGKVRDWQGRGVGGKDAILRDHGFDLCCDLCLDFWVFEHGFDNQIAAFESIKICRRCDHVQQRVFLLRCRLFTCDALVHVGRGVGLALVSAFLGLVNQHDVDTGLCGDKCDACTHHTRTQDAQLFDALIWNIHRANRAFVERFFVQEQRADHRRRRGVHQNVGEPTGLYFEGCVEGNKRALIDG